MQDYLPPSVQDAFLTTVTEFMLLPWREAARHSLALASQGGTQVGWPPLQGSIVSPTPTCPCGQGSGCEHDCALAKQNRQSSDIQAVSARMQSAKHAPQAAADARGAAEVQAAWLAEHMGPHFGRRLLGVVRNIQRFMGAHDGRPQHQFPRLAGSHLSEARALFTALSLQWSCCRLHLHA